MDILEQNFAVDHKSRSKKNVDISGGMDISEVDILGPNCISFDRSDSVPHRMWTFEEGWTF